MGGIGFFDCVNDQAAGVILFVVAKHWLVQKGMQALDGPIQCGERARWGAQQPQLLRATGADRRLRERGASPGGVRPPDERRAPSGGARRRRGRAGPTAASGRLGSGGQDRRGGAPRRFRGRAPMMRTSPRARGVHAPDQRPSQR